MEKMLSLVILGLTFQIVVPQVIDLDDSFIDKKGDESWLIEFYAPWCGHCRKLEPIYHQVYLDLKNTPIRVAKLDATRFGSVASQYEVRGYPTIKFVQGDTSYTHKGDRSKESIIEFAKRAHGPQVRPLSNIGKFHMTRSEHSDQVFFLYIGPQEEDNHYYATFKAVAVKYATASYFYSGVRRILPRDVIIKNEPTALVFKDGAYHEFEPKGAEVTQEELQDWVNGERYLAFPRINGGQLNEMGDMNKYIAIIVTSDKEDDEILKSKIVRFKEMGKMLATKHRDRYHKSFQFIWMPDAESANSITMATVPVPSIIVLEPWTQYYYLTEMPSDEMTLDEMAEFLDQIKEGKSPALGGNSFAQRFKRMFFDIWMTVYTVWHESPLIAVFLFGVPVAAVSMVCYMICCLEAVDESSIYERDWNEEDDEEEEKMEGQPLLPPAGDGNRDADASTKETSESGHIKSE